MPKASIRLVPVLLCLLALLTSGCAVVDRIFLPGPEETARELFDAGQLAMADKRYTEAADYFTKVKDRYPFSPFTIQAELGLADAHFLRQDWPAAVSAYKEYEDLHPRDEKIPYVLSQVGLANLNSFESIDRPMSNIVEALEYFTKLQQGYPTSSYAKEAEKHIPRARQLLAEHELFVADFYWRSGRYGSAWRRYAFVAETYQDLPEIAAYARQRSQVAYMEYQRNSSEEERSREHGSWKRLFQWL